MIVGVCGASILWRVGRAADPGAAVQVSWEDRPGGEFSTNMWTWADAEAEDPWGRGFVGTDDRPPLGFSLGPDGVRSADDVSVFGPRSMAWEAALAWRWPIALLISAWLLAVGWAVRLASQPRAREAAAHAAVAAPLVALGALIIATGISSDVGEWLAPAARWSELAFGATLLAVGLASAVGARAWARGSAPGGPRASGSDRF